MLATSPRWRHLLGPPAGHIGRGERVLDPAASSPLDLFQYEWEASCVYIYVCVCVIVLVCSNHFTISSCQTEENNMSLSTNRPPGMYLLHLCICLFSHCGKVTLTVQLLHDASLWRLPVLNDIFEFFFVSEGAKFLATLQFPKRPFQYGLLATKRPLAAQALTKVRPAVILCALSFPQLFNIGENS